MSEPIGLRRCLGSTSNSATSGPRQRGGRIGGGASGLSHTRATASRSRLRGHSGTLAHPNVVVDSGSAVYQQPIEPPLSRNAFQLGLAGVRIPDAATERDV